jgi:hypothetical protein
MATFQASGIPVARIQSEIPALVAEALSRRRRRPPAPKTKPAARVARASRNGAGKSTRARLTRKPARPARRKVAARRGR